MPSIKTDSQLSLTQIIKQVKEKVQEKLTTEVETKSQKINNTSLSVHLSNQINCLEVEVPVKKY